MALNLIRNRKIEEFHQETEERQELVQQEAKILYGLIHARFITTKQGLYKMREKYNNKEFGICLRNYCHQQALLPVAITDKKHKEHVRLYCCQCEDIYHPIHEYHKEIDGAYFGTTFAHLFLLQFPTYKPQWKSSKKYQPKVFGYKLHKTWHQRAIETAMGKFTNNDKYRSKKKNIELNDENDHKNEHKENVDMDMNKDDMKELNYLRRIKETHLDEIDRLQQVNQEQEKEIRDLNRV